MGVGISFIRPSFNKQEYQSLVIEVKDNYYIASSSFEKFYIYEKEHTHEVGDILLLKGWKDELSFSTIESSFDFKDYLNRKGIYKEFHIESKEIIFSNPIKINKLKKYFLSHFDSDTSALISSIFFGKSDLEETIDLFKELHLARLITNSGIFLNLYYLVFIFIAGVYLKDKKSRILGIILFTIYSIFTYPRFVVFKFLIIQIFRFINEYKFKKRFRYIELLSISGIIFLFFDYHLAYQDSFFLAYSIPILVIISLASFKRGKKWTKFILIPVIVAIFFIPFNAKYYHEISILSFFLQFIMIPFLYVYSFLTLICFMGLPLYDGMNGFTHFLNGTLSFFKPVLFKIYILDMSQIGMSIYIILYLLILYLLSIRFIDLLKIFGPIFLCFNFIYILPIRPLILTTVSFINVGQGNSCIINQNNVTVMIDTGGLTNRDIAKDCLIPYLKKNQIYDIDLLITTHDDFDHSGGVTSLIENFKVKEYIKDYQYFPIKIGKMELINYNIYPYLWEEENDESLVISFKIKDTKFLIMGDAPKKIERNIMKDYPNLDTDILLVGHHGSNTSTDPSFIKMISPKEAVISCGKNNKYGHPHKSVVSILKSNHIKIRRTDSEGTITYSFLL